MIARITESISLDWILWDIWPYGDLTSIKSTFSRLNESDVWILISIYILNWDFFYYYSGHTFLNDNSNDISDKFDFDAKLKKKRSNFISFEFIVVIDWICVEKKTTGGHGRGRLDFSLFCFESLIIIIFFYFFLSCSAVNSIREEFCLIIALHLREIPFASIRELSQFTLLLLMNAQSLNGNNSNNNNNINSNNTRRTV